MEGAQATRMGEPVRADLEVMVLPLGNKCWLAAFLGLDNFHQYNRQKEVEHLQKLKVKSTHIHWHEYSR